MKVIVMAFSLEARYTSAIIHIDDYASDGQQGTEDQAANHEIEIVRSGVFMRRDVFGRSMIDTNHVVFFNRDQPYQIEHPLGGGDQTTIFTIPDTVLHNLMCTHDPSTHDRLHQPFAFSHAPINPRQRLKLIQIVHLITHHQLPATVAMDEQLLIVLGEIVAASYHMMELSPPKPRSVTRSTHIELANNTKLLLAKSYHKRLTLDEIAQAVYTSPYHLCRIFRRETGQTIHNHIQHLRLYHALERITCTHEDDFTSMALDLGFSSHSHFSTVFLRTFGMTPSTFRNSVNGQTLAELSKILKV